MATPELTVLIQIYCLSRPLMSILITAWNRAPNHARGQILHWKIAMEKSQFQFGSWLGLCFYCWKHVAGREDWAGGCKFAFQLNKRPVHWLWLLLTTSCSLCRNSFSFLVKHNKIFPIGQRTMLDPFKNLISASPKCHIWMKQTLLYFPYSPMRGAGETVAG